MQELRLFNVGKISIHSSCGSHIGAQNNAHQPIFPYNVTANSPTSLAYNLAVFVLNNFKFGKDTLCGFIVYIEIWSNLIIICTIIF